MEHLKRETGESIVETLHVLEVETTEQFFHRFDFSSKLRFVGSVGNRGVSRESRKS